MVSAQNLVLELLLWKYRKNLFATAALTAAWFLANEGIKKYTRAQTNRPSESQGIGHGGTHAWIQSRAYSEPSRQILIPIEGTGPGGPATGRRTRIRIE